MPKVARTLTKLEVDQLISRSTPGVTNYHRVGGVSGLLLRISVANTTSWVLRASFGGKQRDIGLGGTRQVSLRKARGVAKAHRKLISQGVDPIDRSRRAKGEQAASRRSSMTITAASLEYHQMKVKPVKSIKESKHFLSSLSRHVFPSIGNLPVLELKTNDVRRTFEPIWGKIPRMARDTLSRLEQVIGYAFVINGVDDRKNPAQWKKNIEMVLPSTEKMMRLKNGRLENHHPSLHFSQVPKFVAELKSWPGNAARALEFGIYTGARNSEVRLARWDEFNLSKGTWTIPAERTKQQREHIVLLPRQVLKLLLGIERSCEFVFPNPHRLRPFSDMVFISLIKRINAASEACRYIDSKMGNRRITFHGFRSSLLTWNAEAGGYAKSLGEMTIGHQVRGQLEAAYDRSELFQKRKELLQQWADYISVDDEWPTQEVL
jgi:integrase